MRVPISVQIEPYNVDDSQPIIDKIRKAFCTYLEGVWLKSTQSKHGLMGPVGKILNEVKSGRRDPSSLKGYAVRVHEATGRSPSPESLQALEQGIDNLVNLLKEAPVVFQDRILDRLDYGLYFDLRKKALESKDARRQAWIGFIRDKYCSETALSEAWGEDVADFDDLYLPKRVKVAESKKATEEQRDIAAFWDSQSAAAQDIKTEED